MHHVTHSPELFLLPGHLSFAQLRYSSHLSFFFFAVSRPQGLPPVLVYVCVTVFYRYNVRTCVSVSSRTNRRAGRQSNGRGPVAGPRPLLPNRQQSRAALQSAALLGEAAPFPLAQVGQARLG